MKDAMTTSRHENTHLDEEEEEEEEEALSLSGLIQNSDDSDSFQDSRSRSSSSDQPSDFFEFFSQTSFEMSHAEDIIFCGKLIPSYKEQQQQHPLTNPKLHSFHRRRSESMSDLNTIRSNSSIKSKVLMRNSRSLDYQKLYGKSKSSEKFGGIERSLSSKSSSGSLSKITDVNLKEKLIPRQRWYYFWTFGLVKLPSEMALEDIKNRQVRRKEGSLFSLFNGAVSDTSSKDDRRSSSSWDDLLRVLSCKDDASVAVTTPFSYPQHV